MHKVDPKLLPVESNFLSIERDMYLILHKLFEERPNVAEALKRLLVINHKQSIQKIDDKYVLNESNSEIVKQVLDMELPDLMEEGYVKIVPKIPLPEHEKVRSYIVVNMDDFMPNGTNPQYRDCIVSFNIVCHPECWNLYDYQLRPFKIAGYIDAVLNNAKLTGIGTFQFLGCNQFVLDDNFSGYRLSYMAVHGSDDWLPGETYKGPGAE